MTACQTDDREIEQRRYWLWAFTVKLNLITDNNIQRMACMQDRIMTGLTGEREEEQKRGRKEPWAGEAKKSRRRGESGEGQWNLQYPARKRRKRRKRKIVSFF